MKGKFIKNIKEWIDSHKKEKSFTKEEFEKKVTEVIKANMNAEKNYIRHHQWEEGGEKFSAWEICTNGHTVWTGDGGIELFNEAFRKAIKDEL